MFLVFPCATGREGSTSRTGSPTKELLGDWEKAAPSLNSAPNFPQPAFPTEQKEAFKSKAAAAGTGLRQHMKNSNHLLPHKTTTEQSRHLFPKQEGLDPLVTSRVEAALSCTRIETLWKQQSRDWLLHGFGRSRIWLLAPWKDKEFVCIREILRGTQPSPARSPHSPQTSNN